MGVCAGAGVDVLEVKGCQGVFKSGGGGVSLPSPVVWPCGPPRPFMPCVCLAGGGGGPGSVPGLAAVCTAPARGGGGKGGVNTVRRGGGGGAVSHSAPSGNA